MGVAGAQVPLRLQIGRMVVAAGDAAAIDQAVAAANAAARVEGLEDGFNPLVIDAAKARAFAAALAASAGELAGRLGGRALDVDALHMRIGVASPTNLASFASVRIELGLEHPNSVSGRALVAVDCEAARARAAEARKRAQASEAEVKRLTYAAQSAAKRRRFLLSHVWLDNAEAVVACAPGDKAAAADRDAADKMMHASIVPTGGSME